MKREDIAQALHLTAMGRANHPLQVELIDALEKLLDKPEPVVERNTYFDKAETVAVEFIAPAKKAKAK